MVIIGVGLFTARMPFLSANHNIVSLKGNYYDGVMFVALQCSQCSNYMEARVCQAPSLIFTTPVGLMLLRKTWAQTAHTYFCVIRLLSAAKAVHC